jgi:hypothetical protein
VEDKIVNLIEVGSSNEVESLLQKGANVNFVDSKTGNSFLHLAIAKGNDAIAKVLINHKIKLDIRNTNGMTPLHLAIESFLKPKSNSLESRGSLFASSPSPTYFYPISSTTGNGIFNSPSTKSTHEIPSGNKISSAIALAVVRLLLSAGASPDALDKNGIAPLYKLAKFIFCTGNRNNMPSISTPSIFITSIPDKNLVYDNPMLDIMPAREIMKALLEKGADIFAGKDNEIPAMFECVHTVLTEVKFEQSLQNLQKQFEQQTKEIEVLRKQVNQLTKSPSESEQAELQYEKSTNNQIIGFFKPVEEKRTLPSYLNIKHPETLMQEVVELLKKHGIEIKDKSEIPVVMEELVKQFDPVKKVV